MDTARRGGIALPLGIGGFVFGYLIHKFVPTFESEGWLICFFSAILALCGLVGEGVGLKAVERRGLVGFGVAAGFTVLSVLLVVGLAFVAFLLMLLDAG
jgi:hypothetical protein